MEKNYLPLLKFVFLNFFYTFFLNQDIGSYSPCKCPTQNVVFNTQKQINEFGKQHPKCTEILGNLIISGHDIEHLDGLSQLQSIGGFLHIVNNGRLKNLNGLSQVSDIFGELLIIQNHQLENLEGLAEMLIPKFVSKGQYSKNKKDLTNLDPIGRDFIISKNHQANNLEDLPDLAAMNNYFLFADKSHLDDLNGFFQITSFGKELSIIKNQKTNRFLIIVNY